MMNLRKSWVNVSLLKLIIKNNLFPAKISLIIFTAVYLLSLLVINSDFNVICLIVFAFSAVILTFIYPCYLQSYLVDKNKSALIVSLPLDTKTVWLTNYLAGYLIEQLGKIPKENEKPVVETKDATYKIEKVKERKIIEVKACKNKNIS